MNDIHKICCLLMCMTLLFWFREGGSTTLEALEQQENQRQMILQQLRDDLIKIEEQQKKISRKKGGAEDLELRKQAVDLNERIYWVEKDETAIQELRELVNREMQIKDGTNPHQQKDLRENLNLQKGIWESQLVKKKDLRDILSQEDKSLELIKALDQEILDIQNEIQQLNQQIHELEKSS